MSALTRRDFIAKSAIAGISMLALPIIEDRLATPLGSWVKEAAAQTGDSKEKSRVLRDSLNREVLLPEHINSLSPAQPLAQQLIEAFAPALLAPSCYKTFPSNSFKFRTSREAVEWIFETARTDREKLTSQIKVTGVLRGRGDLSEKLKDVRNSSADIVLSVEGPRWTSLEMLDQIQKESGKPTLYLNAMCGSYSEVFTLLGDVLSMESRGKVLAEYMDRNIALLMQGQANRKDKKPKAVYYAEGMDCLTLHGRGTFHEAIINLAGGVLATDIATPRGQVTVTPEYILELDPEVLIFESRHDFFLASSIYAKKTGIDFSDCFYSSLSAVKKGNILTPQADWLSYPPLHPQAIGALWLGKALYPDDYKYSLVEQVREYYDIFLNRDCSKENAQRLLELTAGTKSLHEQLIS